MSDEQVHEHIAVLNRDFRAANADRLAGSPSVFHPLIADALFETFNGRLRDELLNEEVFTGLADARRKLSLWRYDYNNLRPHSALNGQSPASARRALELQMGSAHGALANPEVMSYSAAGLS